jgi:thiazolinyl imide reductase
MKTRRLRTIVCGSTFGQFYLEALKLLAQEFEISGLLARGSARSQECAAYYGINLYTEVDRLPPDLDCACVVLRSAVLGGQGTDLALQLLERGVHVIQEQPLHQKDVAACLRAANRKGVFFQIGDLYRHLPEIRRFIACAQVMLGRREALYIDAAFASQVSYPMVRILAEALPAIRPWRTVAGSHAGGPFQVLTGKLGKIPAILRVHNEVDPGDPDNYLHLLHQMTLGCAGGSLALTDTHGPVVWRPRLHIPKRFKVYGAFSDAASAHLLENTVTALGTWTPASYQEILTKQWPRAIARDLAALREMILGNGNAPAQAQRELLCSAQWHELTAALGYPALRPGYSHQPFPTQLLKEAAAPICAEPGQELSAASCFKVKTELASCTEYADSELHGITAGEVSLFLTKLDQAVSSSMIYALQSRGALSDAGREYGLTEILLYANTAPEHLHLIIRWLDWLSGHGYLQRRGEYFRGAGAVTEASLKGRWDDVRQIWNGRLGPPPVIDYFVSNVEHLPQLISGKQQAALLLFPEGKTDLADALYRETRIARYLNSAVAEAVIRIGAARKIAAKVNTETPLRILEIGAGTGATTGAVASRLKAAAAILKPEYLFTDVANFFLLAARKRFPDCPWMRFQTVDIDRDLVRQGLECESVAIIIAAGVLNNAVDTDATVDGLMRLLVPGGWLLLTEPVREFPEILISQAFMMTCPQDGRKQTKTTFMAIEQWREVFRKAGAAEVLIFPDEDHPLAPFGQKFFAIRRKNNVAVQSHNLSGRSNRPGGP